MAGWNHNNANWKPKACVTCGASFMPKSGVHKFCSTECKGKWKYVTGQGSTENQYAAISGNWERYLSRRLYVGGVRREKTPRDALFRVLVRQNYRCALSGVPLTCILEKGRFVPTNASVDRIVAGGPYTEDNVQLVCAVLNLWRGNTPVREFILWCKTVATYQDSLTLQAAQGDMENGHGQKA